MSMRVARLIAVALAAAVTLTSVAVTPASAQRHWHRGDRAFLGAVLGVFGTIAAVAAANRYRDRNYYYGGPYGPYAYYDEPYGYAVPYGYYGGGPYIYSRPRGGFRHWRHHHHH